MLGGIHWGYSASSAKLMAGEWRDATYAEYAKLPLENCYALDEARLLGSPDAGSLGYSIEQLAFLSGLAVPYGGLLDINLRAGETVIVAPATRAFGGAAVNVALAMGAKVIAMGRNKEALSRIAATSERVRAVQITGG
jgi:D-arabinose 1-dehydrogenase-like Zn-dependent alcohol dehydrogenase